MNDVLHAVPNFQTMNLISERTPMFSTVMLGAPPVFPAAKADPHISWACGVISDCFEGLLLFLSTLITFLKYRTCVWFLEEPNVRYCMQGGPPIFLAGDIDPDDLSIYTWYLL